MIEEGAVLSVPIPSRTYDENVSSGFAPFFQSTVGSVGHGTDARPEEPIVQTGSASQKPRPKKLPRPVPIAHASGISFKPQKKFLGFVTAVKEDSFTARLYENYSETTGLFAEFSFDEIPERERCMIAEGSHIEWIIYYKIDHGTTSRVSEVQPRRMLAVDSDEILKSGDRIARLIKAIPWK